MTAVECAKAVKFAVWQVLRFKGLTIWQRLQLAILKIVAVCGYHYGKYLSYVEAPQGSGPTATREEALQTAHIVSRLNARQPKVDGHNFIAVVLPILARSELDLALLFKVLQHLSRQKRPADLIVLVDDGSPLTIPSVIASQGLALIHLNNNKGPATARNCGIALAKERGANVICFLDADCQPDSDWIAMMEQAQQQTPGIVCGKTLSDARNTAVGLYHEVFGTLNGRMLEDGSVLYGCTCNLSISLAGVDLLFDTSFPAASFEDVEFCIRAKKKGIPLTYHPLAIVHHHFEPNWMALFLQFKRYGRFERQTAMKHKEYLPWLWSSHEISCLAENGLLKF